MTFHFRFERALQASACLLRLDGKRMGYLRLLTRGIVEKLAAVTERYHRIDDWELSEETHGFAEWADHFDGGARPIPWQDMLTAQGKPEMIAAVERDEAARQVFDDVFGPEP